METAERKNRIVIAEDEPLIGAALEELLVELGYEVPRVIDSVDDIVVAWRECRPDVVLMDINLRSFSDGIDAAKRLRLISTIPVVFLTAYTDDSTRRRAGEIAGTAFVGKPLDERVLADAIARMLVSVQ